MRGRKFLVCVLTVLCLTVLTVAPALAVAVGPYDVSFVTMRYDYPDAGNSTWYYTVTSTVGENEISHVVFQLGACCKVVDAGVWTDLDTRESWLDSERVIVDYDPTTELFGIKFDVLVLEGETFKFYFTVQGNHALAADGIKVAVKTGGGGSTLLRSGASVLASVSGVVTRGLNLSGREFTTYEASIYGPALGCEQTTAVTLSNFSATSPGGSWAPVLFIPGALLGLAALVGGLWS